MDVRHLLLVYLAVGFSSGSQDDIDYMAKNLDIRYQVLSNFDDDSYGLPKTVGEILLTNTGGVDIEGQNWEICFNSARLFEQDTLLSNPEEGAPLGTSGLFIYHISGSLHMISPGPEFGAIIRLRTIVAPFNTTSWTVSKSDVLPNWYVTWYDAEPRLMESTAGEPENFVAPFVRQEQWKRRPFDEYEPYTPEQRFEINRGTSITRDIIPIIPTPVEYEWDIEESFNITKDWVILVSDEGALDAAWFLSERLGLNISFDANSTANGTTEGIISLSIDDVYDLNGTLIMEDEAYSIITDSFENSFAIVGTDLAGIFHGAQSFWSLYNEFQSSVPCVTVSDYPRFSYRGLMVDVARNFLPKEEIVKLLEAMSMYKMNKFHFHLTDDEGWRLEIPGIEELTEIGSQRCHDLDRKACVGPQLGSGPDNTTLGSGFYSVQDYRDILRFAASRNIEVIPEFKMPGHSHAAILAMEARYHKYKDSDETAATEYLLSDLNDTSVYITPNLYRDSAVNPCMLSTYDFIQKVVREVKAMHKGIQNLKTFHFGGNKEPTGAWSESPECELLDMNPAELKEMFVYRVADILESEGLQLGGWATGFLGPEDGNSTVDLPYNRTRFPQEDVFAYAWKNVWENGQGSSAYMLANQDYKVVLSHASAFYLDVAHEPDPDELGAYLGTRFTETRDTFNYMPDSVYDNIEVDLFGRPLDRDELCNEVGCERLLPGNEDNVIGIQGQLWTEGIRGSRAAEYMLFPRLVALAERAWHKASWEDEIIDEERVNQRDNDWKYFANTLGFKELRRLDRLDIDYRVPTPGARGTIDFVLEANVNLPGLPMQYSIDKGLTWTPIIPGFRFSPGQEVVVRTISADLSRYSREVTIKMPAASNIGKMLKKTGKVLKETVQKILHPLPHKEQQPQRPQEQPQRSHEEPNESQQSQGLHDGAPHKLNMDNLGDEVWNWEYNSAKPFKSSAPLVLIVTALCALLAV